MKNRLLIRTLLSSLFSANAQQPDIIKILGSSEFKEAIANKKVQLVDIRTADEFNQEAIDHTLKIDFFQQENFRIELEKRTKYKPVYMHCRWGSRSQSSSEIRNNKIYQQSMTYKADI